MSDKTQQLKPRLVNSENRLSLAEQDRFNLIDPEIRRCGKLIFGPLAGEKIGLLAEIEERVLIPLGIFEPMVSRSWLDERRHGEPHHARQDVVPKRTELPEEFSLGF